MEIIIRPAQRDELAAVNRIREQVNRLHVEGRPDIFRPGFGEEIRRRVFDAFEDPAEDVIAALMDGCVVGYAMLQAVERPLAAYNLPRRFCHVQEFGVDARFQRRGVATALMRYIQSEARQKGFDHVDLDAWEFNRDALAFYASAGFKTYRRYLELPLDETP